MYTPINFSFKIPHPKKGFHFMNSFTRGNSKESLNRNRKSRLNFHHSFSPSKTGRGIAAGGGGGGGVGVENKVDLILSMIFTLRPRIKSSLSFPYWRKIVLTISWQTFPVPPDHDSAGTAALSTFLNRQASFSTPTTAGTLFKRGTMQLTWIWPLYMLLIIWYYPSKL